MTNLSSYYDSLNFSHQQRHMLRTEKTHETIKSGSIRSHVLKGLKKYYKIKTSKGLLNLSIEFRKLTICAYLPSTQNITCMTNSRSSLSLDREIEWKADNKWMFQYFLSFNCQILRPKIFPSRVLFAEGK